MFNVILYIVFQNAGATIKTKMYRTKINKVI